MLHLISRPAANILGLVSDPHPTPSAASEAAPRTASAHSGGVFATTHWSWVVSAQNSDSPDFENALENLCKAYWYPLYAYARRTGKSPADSEDLTQGFFARLLEKGYVRAASPEKGRFRTFMLMALKRYMANEWDRQHARKRGGFSECLSIDVDSAESRLAEEMPGTTSPEVAYDRQWAVTLLGQTLQALKAEYVSTGRQKLFENLQSCLGKSGDAPGYSEIASKMGLTEAAVKMAVHRLRRRYREVLREQVARTVASPEQVDQEIKELFAVF